MKNKLAKWWSSGLITLAIIYLWACLMLFLCIYEINTLRSLTAITKTGVVVSRDGDGLVVRFHTQDSKSVIFTSSDPLYHIGDNVTVRYDPHHPAVARVDDVLDLGVLLVLFVVIFFLLFFTALASTWAYITEKPVIAEASRNVDHPEI